MAIGIRRLLRLTTGTFVGLGGEGGDIDETGAAILSKMTELMRLDTGSDPGGGEEDDDVTPESGMMTLALMVSVVDFNFLRLP